MAIARLLASPLSNREVYFLMKHVFLNSMTILNSCGKRLREAIHRIEYKFDERSKSPKEGEIAHNF